MIRLSGSACRTKGAACQIALLSDGNSSSSGGADFCLPGTLPGCSHWRHAAEASIVSCRAMQERLPVPWGPGTPYLGIHGTHAGSCRAFSSSLDQRLQMYVRQELSRGMKGKGSLALQLLALATCHTSHEECDMRNGVYGQSRCRQYVMPRKEFVIWAKFLPTEVFRCFRRCRDDSGTI